MSIFGPDSFAQTDTVETGLKRARISSDDATVQIAIEHNIYLEENLKKATEHIKTLETKIKNLEKEEVWCVGANTDRVDWDESLKGADDSGDGASVDGRGWEFAGNFTFFKTKLEAQAYANIINRRFPGIGVHPGYYYHTAVVVFRCKLGAPLPEELLNYWFNPKDDEGVVRRR